MTKRHIVVSSTFDASALADTVHFWIERLALPVELSLADPYQTLQQLLDPGSTLRRNEGGLNVLLLRAEDLAGADHAALDNLGDFGRAVEMAAGSASPYLVCEGRPSAQASDDQQLRAAVASMFEGIEQLPGVRVVTPELVDEMVPVDEVDARPNDSDLLPYGDTYYVALGTVIAREAYRRFGGTPKVLALDCDNTLWRGVCAEDGPEGVVADAGAVAVQELAVRQAALGRLVCLCSKNLEEDVLRTFASHPEFPLTLDHISGKRVDWQPKSVGLRSLAKAFNLGLDSFVFLDDSPVECAEVRSHCPEVLCFQLPESAADVAAFLRHVWPLDPGETTEMDAARARFYEQEERRREARSADLDDFFANLELNVDIHAATDQEIERISQLTYRTNQFNARVHRRSPEELRALVAGGRHQVFTATVADRFGDYGLVGVLIVELRDEALWVDTFLLSCRALGRGVEHRLLAQLGDLALDGGGRRVEIPLVETERNEPIRRFLSSTTGSPDERPSGLVHTISATAAAAVVFDPSEVSGAPRGSGPERSESIEPSVSAADPAREERGRAAPLRFLESIPVELTSAEAIEAAVTAYRRERHGELDTADPAAAAGEHGDDAPTPTEAALLEIWQQALAITDIGLTDDFFGLRGDSLAIVRIVAKVRARWELPLVFQELFEHPTVSSMAAMIDERLGGAEGESPASALPSPATSARTVAEGPAPSVSQESRGRSPATNLETSPPTSQPASWGAPSLSANPRRAPVRHVGVRTCDRPAELERCLQSFVDNVLAHGRDCEFVVVDDSRDPRARQENRDLLQRMARARGVRISYAGREDKERFAGMLSRRASVPEAVVQNALLGGSVTGLATYGANNNALALAAPLEPILALDDDTEGRIVAAPGGDAPPESQLRGDPCAYTFFPDRQGLLEAVEFTEADLVGMHDELLGRRASEIVPVDGAEGERSEVADRTVAVTFNGLAGDCGWGAPFGVWVANMGYLILEDGDSHRRMVASPEAYRTASTSREILRLAPRTTLTDDTFSMTTFHGNVGGEILPPSVPVSRGHDVLWGYLVTRCVPNACFAHLPFALLHTPPRRRRFWEGELFRTARGFDTTKLMLCVFRAAAEGLSFAGEPGARQQALGDAIVELSSGSPQDFDRAIVEQYRLRVEEFATEARDWIERRADSLDAWKQDVIAYVERAEEFALEARAGTLLAMDLPIDAGENARVITREYGELLQHWPALMKAARELHLGGSALATPVTGARVAQSS